MTERYWDRGRDWERGRRARAEGYYGDPEEREYGRRGEERGFLDRAGDEVRSWFGDDAAARRRGRDERETARWGGGPDEVDREWARQWGYVEGRGEPRGSERMWPRGWGYSGGYGAGPGYRASSDYDYGSPGSGWRPGPPERSQEYERPREGFWRRGLSRGPNAGRGPRGYQRSDDRIREDICERMCEDDQLDASDIEIRVASGEVTLAGTVQERHDKRLAEDLAESVSGVREVNNQLRVSPGPSAQEGPGRSGEPPRYRVA